MKLGICVPHYGRPIEVDRMLAVVRHVEAVGLDSVWVTGPRDRPPRRRCDLSGAHARKR